MAITKSGVYAPAFMHALGSPTAVTLNLIAATHKVAMYTNQLVPDFSLVTNAAYSATNEVSGPGYTAGGKLLVSPTFTESPSGTALWTSDNPVWAASQISSARCAVVYANALTPKYNICLLNFGLDYSSNFGSFIIQWPSVGIVSWVLN